MQFRGFHTSACGHSGFSRFPRTEQLFFHNYRKNYLFFKKSLTENKRMPKCSVRLEVCNSEGLYAFCSFSLPMLVTGAKELLASEMWLHTPFPCCRRFRAFSLSFLFHCFRHYRKLTQSVVTITGIDCVGTKIHPIHYSAFWKLPAKQMSAPQIVSVLVVSCD